MGRRREGRGPDRDAVQRACDKNNSAAILFYTLSPPLHPPLELVLQQQQQTGSSQQMSRCCVFTDADDCDRAHYRCRFGGENSGGRMVESVNNPPPCVGPVAPLPPPTVYFISGVSVRLRKKAREWGRGVMTRGGMKENSEQSLDPETSLWETESALVGVPAQQGKTVWCR